MADNSVSRGKLMSIRDIEVMEMEQQTLKLNTPHMLYKQGPINSMSRPCKLFIKVDTEGLLIDTISISDVVNFDSYESIVSSSRRIISCFQSTKADQIEVQAVYFYKKRARSTRMNPVRIYNTTDGFRAVAEHPTGEVPLGVRWIYTGRKTQGHTLQQTTIENLAGLKKPPGLKNLPEDLMSIKSVNQVPVNQVPQDDVPNKKRCLMIPKTVEAYTLKRDNGSTPEYKNAGWPLPEGSVVILQQQTEPTMSHRKVSETPPPARSPHGQPVHNPSAVQTDFGAIKAPSVTGSCTRVPPSQVPHMQSAPAPVKSGTRHPHLSPYLWPDDASMEVVITYNGVKERRKLSPDLIPAVVDLLRSDHTLPDLHKYNFINCKMSSGQGQAQEKLQEHVGRDNFYINNLGLPAAQPKTEIKYLSEAKAEIFKTLSMVNVSRSRFKQLLAWLRSLRLEEGNQGKFYLSERNVVSGTRVTYNTDEEAAAKLSYLMKNRVKPPAVLHPEPQPPPPTVTTAASDHALNNQLYFLMPNKTALTCQPGVGGAPLLPAYTNAMSQPAALQHLVTPQGLVTLSTTGVTQVKDTTSVTASTTTNKSTKAALRSVLKRAADDAGKSVGIDTKVQNSVGKLKHKPRSSPSPEPDPHHRQVNNLSDANRSFGGTEHAYSNNVPRILRSRRKVYNDIHPKEYANSDPELNPVPTHLIARSLDNHSVNTTDKYEVPFQIKEEPVDYESTASDTTEDYNERLSGHDLPPGMELYTDHAESTEGYNYSDVGILNADERLPQTDEFDKPFELIVKEEPVDTYEDQ